MDTSAQQHNDAQGKRTRTGTNAPYPASRACSSTRAARMRSSSAVVHAPMKQPSSALPATSSTPTTAAGPDGEKRGGGEGVGEGRCGSAESRHRCSHMHTRRKRLCVCPCAYRGTHACTHARTHARTRTHAHTPLSGLGKRATMESTSLRSIWCTAAYCASSSACVKARVSLAMQAQRRGIEPKCMHKPARKDRQIPRENLRQVPCARGLGKDSIP